MKSKEMFGFDFLKNNKIIIYDKNTKEQDFMDKLSKNNIFC